MQRPITTKQELEAAINELERTKDSDAVELKEYFHETYENLKPGNIIKHAFHELEPTAALGNDLVKGAIALAIGYIFKRLFQAVSNNAVGFALANIIPAFLSGYLLKNPEIVKKFSIYFLRLLFRKRLQHREQLRLQQA